MSAPLRLHWSPDSANLPVRMTLEHLGLAYEGVRVDRARGGQRAPAYLARNPQGLIPVLEDGEIVIFETGAILLHLAEEGGPLPRAERARLTKWLFWLSNTVHADLRVAFYAARWAPAAPEDLREAAARRLAEHAALAERIIATGDWPEGPGPADFYLGCCLRWARIYPNAAPLGLDLAGLPALKAHLSRLEQLPAVARALAAEVIPGVAFTAPARPALPLADITGG